MHAVIGGTNMTETLFVCRTRGGGELSRPGQLDWKGCHVVIGQDNTETFQQYQVLINADGSARLEWVDWKQFTALPPGAVNVANDVYVAREIANAKFHNFLGGLYLQEQYGLIVLPPNGRKLTLGKCPTKSITYTPCMLSPGRPHKLFFERIIIHLKHIHT